MLNTKTRHHTLWLNILLLAISALLLSACGDAGDDADEGTATVQGRLEQDEGNQHTSDGMQADAEGSSEAAIDADTIIVSRMASDGSLSAVAEASISASGRFEITGLPAIEGPFIVQAVKDGESEARAQVLVLEDLADGEMLTTLPISAETTAEAQAYVSLVASGVPASDIDGVALMSHISAEMAASVNTGATLAQHAYDAQVAWRAALSQRLGQTITAAQAQEAHMSAYVNLKAALDASADAGSERAAWGAFFMEAAADVESSLGADASDRESASVSASVTLTLSIDASGASDATTSHTAALGAMITAEAERAALLAAAAKTSASAEASATISAAYDSYIESVRSAATLEVIADARAELDAQIADTSDDQIESALELILEAEGQSDILTLTAFGTLSAAIDAESTALAAALAEARDSGDVATATVTAMAAFEAAVETQVSTTLAATGMGEAAVSFITEANQSSEGSAKVLLDDLRDLNPVGQLDIRGVLSGALGLQAGATGLVEGVELDLSEASGAAIWTIDAEGQIETLATGRFDITEGIVIDDAPSSPDTINLIIIEDGQGELLAGAILHAALEGEGTIQTPPLSLESTTETRVLLDAISRGVMTPQIDFAHLQARVDAAIGAAARTEADIEALTTALLVAQEAHATALGTTAAELAATTDAAIISLSGTLAATPEAAGQAYADFDSTLRADMSAAFEASASQQAFATAQAEAIYAETVAALAGAQSDLSAAADAHARLACASAEVSTIIDALVAAGGDAELEQSLTAALSAFMASTTQAQDVTAVLAADAAYRAEVMGDGSLTLGIEGVLERFVESSYGLDAAVLAEVEASVSETQAASATLQAELEAAISGAIDQASGQLDQAAAATAALEAFASFEASASGAADISGVAGASAQADVVAAVLFQLAAGRHGL